ncbi:MAG: glycosyltransferase family 4 protein [Actinobacteria bacterium]|nr:glycosyltransferase family 4 protein [Actinomycetota bacterium]
MKIAISGEGINGTGAGLGYFLYHGLQELALAMPDWHFEIVSSQSFHQLKSIESGNLRVRFWDDRRFIRIFGSVLGRYLTMSQVDAARQRISSHIPTQSMKTACGNLKALWSSLSDLDVIWVPHFLLGAYTRHLSPMVNLGDLGIPLVMTIHDIHPVFFPNDWPPYSLKRFWEEFVPFATRCAKIITHSNFQKKAIIEHLGIQADKIDVIACPPLLNPTDWVNVTTQKGGDEVLERYGIGCPYVFYPGSSTITHKNHIRLILAWKEIRNALGERCPMLVCTSKSPNWAAIHALIDALDLKDKVVFTDRVDERTLAVLYENCMFVAIPTLYEGGGSGPAVEAILMGKPVLCSDIPQINEQMENAGCKVTTFDPGSVESISETVINAIENLPELEVEAAENQRVLSASFDKAWRHWALEYAERFMLAANQRTSPKPVCQ